MTGRRSGTVSPGSAQAPAAQGREGGGKAVASCPICGKPALAAFRPFCSQRCADVDLGRWLGERYVLPGPETGSDENGHA